MEQCDTPGCTKPARLISIIGADISMTGTSTLSERVVKLCEDCDAQDKRMAELGTPATLKMC